PVVVAAYAAIRVQQQSLMAEQVIAWVEKTPTNEFLIDEILERYPQARFLHILRDPRSIIAAMQTMDSQRERQLFNLEQTCRDMARSFQVALSQRQTHPERYYVLKYEDTILHPQRMMQQVATFLSIEYHDSLIAPTVGSKPMVANSAWAETRTAGVLHNKSLDRWKETLDADTLKPIARVVGHTAQQFGYDIPEPLAGRARRMVAAALPHRVTKVLRALKA
ncbi:MAG: sulfotransferase, partial [Anaerolineae bacterium]|nr:sulfotransferase [Anaerolineae bacterium]